jgi:hypothetical protein
MGGPVRPDSLHRDAANLETAAKSDERDHNFQAAVTDWSAAGDKLREAGGAKVAAGDFSASKDFKGAASDFELAAQDTLLTKNSNRDDAARSLYRTAGGDRMAAGATSMAAGDEAKKSEKAATYLEAWRNFRQAKIDFQNAGYDEGVLQAQKSMNDAYAAAHPKANKGH